MPEHEVYRAIFAADASRLISESRKATEAVSKYSKQLDVLSKRIRQFNERVKKIETTFKEAGDTLTRWGGIVTGVVGGTVTYSLRQFARIEEQFNRFRVAFGEAGQQVEQWATTFAAQANRSRFLVMRLAADYKVLLSAFGLTPDEALRASQALAKLTIDWESFLDIPAEEVFRKIASGLAGETEALRRVGVLVDEQTIKRRALVEGVIREGQQLDQLTKVRLRLKQILEGLPQAMDDARRTADSLTNSWRGLRAALLDLSVTFGKVFVPNAKDGVQSLTDLVRRTDNWVQQNQSLVRSVTITTLKLGAFTIAAGLVSKGIAGVSKLVRGASAAFSFLAKNTWAGVAALVALGSTVLYKVTDSISEATGLKSVLEDVFYRYLFGGRQLEEQAARINAQLEAHRRNAEAASRAVQTLSQSEEQLAQKMAMTVPSMHTASNKLQQITATTQLYTQEIESLTQRLWRLTDEYKRWSQVIDDTTSQVLDVQWQLEQQLLDPWEREVERVSRLQKAWQATLQQIQSGVVEPQEGVQRLRSLLQQLGTIDITIFKDPEYALQRLQQLAADWGQQIQEIAIQQRQRVGDEIAQMEAQIQSMKDTVEELAKSLISLRAEIDTKPAEQALDQLYRRIGEVIAKLQELRPLGGWGYPSTAPIGPLGPELDRLSVRASRHPLHSSTNVVNINAPITFARAEPPSAMAKALAKELTRLERRGQT